jgi:uncharacterized protein (DUF305 family)
VLSLVLIVASVVLALLLGARWSNYAPADDSVDAGFARDMIRHHEQAVQMASIIVFRTENEDIRTLAYDILTTQQAQIGYMGGWLSAWDLLPNSDDPPMSWMGHDMAGQPMPGMASAEEIATLQSLPPGEADVAFLTLMIRHHQGALGMASDAAERADHDYVRTFARSVVATQEAEIANMEALQATLGA